MKISLLSAVLILLGLIHVSAQTKNLLTDEPHSPDSCKYATTGRNDYFILEPGYQLVLEGKDGNEISRLEITVLNETKKIGSVETRVVEENETVNGKTVEISRNFFAICQQTNTVYYFGEEVDIYKNGKITGHEGAWKAEGRNRSGIAMPGKISLGRKYFQEMAPNVAMDRAEIVSESETMKTPAGDFVNCLKIEETNALKPKEKEYKYYAPGIGLIKDDELLLVNYGLKKN